MTTESNGKPARTVGWVVRWFIANDRGGRSGRGRRERGRVLELFLRFRNSDGRVVGELPLDELRGGDLVEFINSQAGGHAQWTRRRWCSTVKRPFREAVKFGFITHSPVAMVTERRGGRGRDLTAAEFRTLLRY